jgi:hypothetical protein
MRMRIWLKSITARTSRPVLWIAGSAIPVLLAVGGLCALGPLNNEPPQPGFFLCFFLFVLFWIGGVTLLVSFNCWIIFKLPLVARAVRFYRHKMIEWSHAGFRRNAGQSFIALTSTRKGEK